MAMRWKRRHGNRQPQPRLDQGRRTVVHGISPGMCWLILALALVVAAVVALHVCENNGARRGMIAMEELRYKRALGER
jgi:hypothetical protein